MPKPKIKVGIVLPKESKTVKVTVDEPAKTESSEEEKQEKK